MNKLLIVLGAGGSKEVGLPVGEELKKEIVGSLSFKTENTRRLTSGDADLFEALNAHVRKANGMGGHLLFSAARRIAAVLPLATSIDNFLDAHRGDKDMELCGKLAIVRKILVAESRSKLNFDHRTSKNQLDYNALNGTWFNSFWQLLCENCTADEIGQRLESIAVVSFNYDRCFAHYLVNALRDYYGLKDNRATELARKVEIFHPYGSVGSLPWADQLEGVLFGAELHAEELLASSSKIKTFTERTDPSSTSAATLLTRAAEATHIVFLGFAFHPQNVSLLWPSQRPRDFPAELCVGTAMGISASDVDVIREQLCTLLQIAPENVKLPHLSCYELFRQYRRTLSSALLACSA